MIIGILGEGSADNRVAITPEHISSLKALKASSILVETNAGLNASYPDADYTAKGAEIVSRQEVISKSDVIIKIHPVEVSELNAMKSKVLIGGFNPLINTTFVTQCLNAGVTAFSLDVIPRTTRAQAMDILSSMATVAGYKAVLTAATHLPKFFPMFMTAAGTITPAKVVVLGAGVAGLQAIATAKR